MVQERVRGEGEREWKGIKGNRGNWDTRKQVERDCEVTMASTILEEKEIKALFKQAMVELLEERRDLFSDVLLEALEEIALVNAIQEGEESESVSRKEIFEILEGAV